MQCTAALLVREIQAIDTSTPSLIGLVDAVSLNRSDTTITGMMLYVRFDPGNNPVKPEYSMVIKQQFVEPDETAKLIKTLPPKPILFTRSPEIPTHIPWKGIQAAVALPPLDFPQTGLYRFDVMLDGYELAFPDLYVTVLE